MKKATSAKQKTAIKNMASNLLLPTVPSADDMLDALHVMIDRKFRRTKRDKYVNPHILKATITLWSIGGEFINYEPKIICKLLKELVARGSVESNLGNENIYPFDAYFIPKTELMNEKSYDTYAYVKGRILA